MRLIEEALRVHLGGKPFERVVRGSVQLGGLPATHVALIGLARESHIVVGRRDRIVYLLVGEWPRFGERLDVQRLTAGFRLLE